ncbi:cobalt-precorrin 5A hydrolase [Pseudorhodoferax soli]|uniref:Cobalt-precorrin 5A hydrolase n=1 Tax=Pseudorhodoferax soli TaxID=545864 RepID=A0A368XXA7_9BURK|nr:cobalt-precorrin 5A hydrolase [Pseudorhodoferax soli]
MTVLGVGFHSGAGAASLHDALRAACAALPAPPVLRAVATAQDKMDSAALAQFAAELRLPLVGVPLPLLAAQPATPSAFAPARYGGRSLAEAAALAAAGPGARLLATRAVSSDRQATAALAAARPHPTDPCEP